jgi:UDP-glucose 4-epimerase
VNCISEALGKKVTLFKVPSFLLNLSRIFLPKIFERLFGSMEFDNARTRKLLDYEAPFSTQEGIKKTVDFYLGSKHTKKA